MTLCDSIAKTTELEEKQMNVEKAMSVVANYFGYITVAEMYDEDEGLRAAL